MLPTREEVEGMRPLAGENIRDFTYRWRQRTSNLKHPMSEYMISTFLKTLGLIYQLMPLIASQGNFAKMIDKATKVELAIKAGLLQDAPLASTRSVLKKAVVTHPEVSIV